MSQDVTWKMLQEVVVVCIQLIGSYLFCILLEQLFIIQNWLKIYGDLDLEIWISLWRNDEPQA